MAKYLNLSGLQTLWAKLKDTFAPKSHTHAPIDINQETYRSLTSTPVEAQFGVVYGVNKGNCLMIEVSVTSLQYNQGVVVYCAKGNRSAMLMLAWSGTSVRCMHINSDHNDSKWIVKYRKVAMTGQTAETATALLLYIYAQDYSTTGNSSRHRIFSVQNGGGVRLKVSAMAVSDILSDAGDVSHDIIDCADSVSHALTFGSKTYDGSSAREITAADIGAVTDISGKVDKVSGKGLSTNDFTSALKTKLNGIADGAEVNVQSDWSQTDTSKDDFIKNKPTSLPANGGNADNAKNVACVKNMYFNTATYALDIKIPNVRTAGTTFLIQMCQNNGNVCVLELSLWRSSGSAITSMKAVLLYCSNYDVSELPKDVFYSKSATTGDNHVYLASNSTAVYSTSFSILYNSNEIAEDRTSSITFGTAARATARGQTKLTVNANGIPRFPGNAVGSSSEPVYVDSNGLLTKCGDIKWGGFNLVVGRVTTADNTVFLL